MKKIFAAVLFSVIGTGAYASVDLDALDTENPLFFERGGDILSVTGADYGDDILGVHQKVSVGIAGRFSINGEINWQHDFGGNQDGFTYSGLGMTYRFNDDGIIADFMANVRFGGKARVPEYADTVYAAGVRAGKRWNRITLAATLETNWIFDDVYGMAYINVTPEFYFRFFKDWSLGLNAMIRKATKPMYDAEWVGGKLVRQYGRTMYAGFGEYEFENDEFRFGARLSILF